MSYSTNQKQGEFKEIIHFQVELIKNNISLPVCKTFYLNTLGIKQDAVYHALSSEQQNQEWYDHIRGVNMIHVLIKFHLMLILF